MAIKKSDYFYLLLCVFLAAIAVVAISHPDALVGLYTGLGLIGIIMVLAIVIKPSLGASILIVAIFTNISNLLTNRGFPGVIKVLVAVVFIAIIVRNYYAGQLPNRRPKTARIEFFIILYLLFVALSYLVADNKDRALSSIEDLIKDIAIIYTILFALRTPRDWKQAVWILIITTVFVSIFGIFQVFTNNYSQNFFGLASFKVDTPNNRLGGPINDPNMWGQVLVAVIPLVIFRIIHDPSKITKLVSVGLLSILLVELLNTYSRGAYLTLAIIVLLVLFVFKKNINLTLAMAMLVLVILITPFIPSSYIDRFMSLSALSPTTEFGIYQDTSFRGRSSELLTGLSIFARNPFLGVGAGNYLNNYQKYSQEIGLELRSEEREAHSLYLQIMAETGIFGIIAFAGIVISLLFGISNAAKSIEHMPQYKTWIPWFGALQISIIGYLLAASVLHGAYIRYFWILVALSITAIQLADEINQNNKQSLTREFKH